VSASDLGGRARAVFQTDAEAVPPMTLRGGAAVDSYDVAPPYDPALDRLDDAYVEAHAYWALPHLDAASWRHYLPALIDYALRHLEDPATMVVEGLLASLRPPDRDPPRLASLSAEQERVVVATLDLLAFDPSSAHRDFAMQVLEEYWVPNALYRSRAAGADAGGPDSQPPPSAR
jgi:hypothetical protein